MIKTNQKLLLAALGVIALSVITSIICCFLFNSHRRDNSDTKQSVYDRILKSGKIRCGYVVYWPGCIKDPNTGKLTGVHVDAMEAIGDKLGLKIEWTEEVGWGSMIEGLQTDRYDAVGSGVWATASRGKYAAFCTPFYYLGPNAYCRIDDHRFDNDLKAIDLPTVRLSTIDGEASDIIARTQFPKAQRMSLPDMATVSQAFLQITGNKADVFMEDPLSAYEFEKNNPGKIKNIAHDKPLRVLPTSIMFRNGEPKLQTMFDKAVDELVLSGEMDRILDKYEPVRGQYYYRRANFYKLAGHNSVN